MKLFLLEAIQGGANDPWEPWWDKAFGFVIRAGNEQEARKYASKQAGDEKDHADGNPWLSSKYSTCVELTEDGNGGVILRDFASA